MDWHYVTAAGRCEGEITTLAPSRANMCAVAAPMPDAAPEMMATLSASLIAVSSLCLECCSAADEAGPPLVASALDQDVEHDAGLVYGSPKPMLYPSNFEHDLVEMPFVANPGKAATDLVGEMLTELARPLSDGFVGDDDAEGRQQLLNHAKPERETEIQPDGIADDLGREPIPGVAGASR